MINLQVANLERNAWISLGLCKDSSEIVQVINSVGHRLHKSVYRYLSPDSTSWVTFSM